MLVEEAESVVVISMPVEAVELSVALPVALPPPVMLSPSSSSAAVARKSKFPSIPSHSNVFSSNPPNSPPAAPLKTTGAVRVVLPAAEAVHVRVVAVPLQPVIVEAQLVL